MVCDYVDNKKYLITEDIYSKIQWNTSQSTVGEYAGSNIKAECDQFAIDTGIDQMDYVIDTGVGKVFIPIKEQMNGGFSWFNSNERRIANLYDRAAIYWTADTYRTDTTYAWMVTTEGSFSIQPKYLSHGFRPCICIQY